MARFIRLARALSPEEAESLASAQEAAAEFRSAERVAVEVFAGYESCRWASDGLVVRLRLGGKTASRLCFTAVEVEAWLKGAQVGLAAGRTCGRGWLRDRLETAPADVEAEFAEAWRKGGLAGFSIWRRAEGNFEPTLFNGVG